MARTNQGIFKKIRNEYDELYNCYTSISNRYFPNGIWNCNYDFVTDFAFSADYIYRDAKALSTKIDTMLTCTKFEMERNTHEFMEMSKKCKEIEQDIKYKFDDILGQILYGGYLSESEEETLNSMTIYRC